MEQAILKQKPKSVVVKFNEASNLRDAPQKKFKHKDYKKGQAQVAAERYAEGVIEMSRHSKNLSACLREIPALRIGKIGFHIDNVKNKTGVVGVHVSKNRAGKETGYVVGWRVNGKRMRTYVSFKENGREDAYKQACAIRMAVLNMNVVMLGQ